MQRFDPDQILPQSNQGFFFFIRIIFLVATKAFRTITTASIIIATVFILKLKEGAKSC
jgi:hypothetical protein